MRTWAGARDALVSEAVLALAERNARQALDALLLERLRKPVPGTELKALVALDVGHGEGWTLHIDPVRLALSAGVHPEADTTIVSDAATMVAILEGSTSGVEVFLDGRLRVRGSLALSLRLSSLLGTEDVPAHFEKAGDITAHGVRTFYLEAGAGDPVILLHGLGGTNASMLPTLWNLARGHRVIAPDLPGFGDSAKPLRSYDAKFFARWLTALLDELGIERASIVGNSMGGRIAIEAALCSPERIDRLVLLAPSPAFIKKRQFVDLVRVLRPELALIPLPLLRHKHVVGGLKRLFSRPERLADSWHAAAANEFLRVFKTPRGRIAFFSAARQIYLEEPRGDNGFWDRLCGLEAPTLFVWGEKDRLVPARFSKHVERALPHSTSVVLEDCGHVPQFELPDEVNRLVREFIDV